MDDTRLSYLADFLKITSWPPLDARRIFPAGVLQKLTLLEATPYPSGVVGPIES